MESSIGPRGDLTIRKNSVIPRSRVHSLADAVAQGTSSRVRGVLTSKGRWQRENRENFERSLHDQDLFDRGQLFAIGHLWLQKNHRDGRIEDFGLASCRVVTTTGVGFIVDALQNLTELEIMKYHGIGTGSAAEAIGNTALTTELTTQYATSGTRPTGTLGEKAGDGTTYETVATIAVSAAVAITEHGIFSQATTGGVMLDRTIFSAVNLAISESIVATYDLTFTPGS